MVTKFNIIKSDLFCDVKVLTPTIHKESRGEIWTSYSTALLGSLVPSNISFKHDKFSESKFNVLRGIHGDHKSWKLVSCVSGTIMQVVVDMRPSSMTYLKWQSFELGPSNRSIILIPPGMGNAFYVSSISAVYHYKLAYDGDYIDADEQFTVSWNDPILDIPWPTIDPVLSKRDASVRHLTQDLQG